MPVFPNLEVESIVQVGDRTRLSGALSYSSRGNDDIVSVEIQPEADIDWIPVTETKYLDWEYATEGTKVCSVRVTSFDTLTKVSTKLLRVISPAEDNLFSEDSDLTAWEPRIMEYLPDGKTSFNYTHREAQAQILNWLDAHKIWDASGARLEASAVVDTKEVREWSKFLTLQIIFEGISNAVDDVFSIKAAKYAEMVATERNRAVVKLDVNGDGKADETELRSYGGSIEADRK